MGTKKIHITQGSKGATNGSFHSKIRGLKTCLKCLNHIQVCNHKFSSFEKVSSQVLESTIKRDTLIQGKGA